MAYLCIADEIVSKRVSYHQMFHLAVQIRIIEKTKGFLYVIPCNFVSVGLGIRPVTI